MRVAVIGSFDVIHNGHVALINLARAISYPELPDIIVSSNGSKTSLMTAGMRLAAIKQVFGEGSSEHCMIHTTGYAANMTTAKYLLRSTKSLVDYDTEQKLAEINRKFCGKETLWMDPADSHLSSSAIKEMFLNCYDFDNVRELVPRVTLMALSREMVYREFEKIKGGLYPEDQLKILNLLGCYDHRGYHNYCHIARMLCHLQTHFMHCSNLERLEYPVTDLILAILLHDVFQVGDSTESAEVKSADVVRDAVSGALIRSTERGYDHEKDWRLTPNKSLWPRILKGMDVLHDLDYAYLGDKEGWFLTNSRGIRQEYSQYSDEEYTAGRLAFLKEALDDLRSDRLFRTSIGKKLWKLKAETNISQEIDILSENQ